MLQLLSDDPVHNSGLAMIAVVIKFGNRQILMENALHSF